MQQFVLGLEIGLSLGRVIKTLYDEWTKDTSKTSCATHCPLAKALLEQNQTK
jgi:hypothetical protein